MYADKHARQPVLADAKFELKLRIVVAGRGRESEMKLGGRRLPHRRPLVTEVTDVHREVNNANYP